MKSKVTTKQGDEGNARALDGEIYKKSHPLMEAVGAVDELRAQTAMLRIRVMEEQPEDHERIAEFLLWLLHTYFPIGTECSDPTQKNPQMRQVELGASHLEKLETEQVWMEDQIDFAKAFIAGASNSLAAQADLASVAVRRLERSVVCLQESVPVFHPDTLLAFINRMSDYFFVLARHLERGDHIPVDYGKLKD